MIRLTPVAALVLFTACGASAPPAEAESPRALSPALTPAPAPVIPKGLTGEQVRPILQEMEASVKGCHAVEFGGQEHEGGTFRIEWTIAPDGKVDDVVIVDSTLGSEAFNACVLAKARQLEFPTATGPTAISKPYNLRRGTEEDVGVPTAAAHSDGS